MCVSYVLENLQRTTTYINDLELQLCPILTVYIDVCNPIQTISHTVTGFSFYKSRICAKFGRTTSHWVTKNVGIMNLIVHEYVTDLNVVLKQRGITLLTGPERNSTFECPMNALLNHHCCLRFCRNIEIILNRIPEPRYVLLVNLLEGGKIQHFLVSSIVIPSLSMSS